MDMITRSFAPSVLALLVGCGGGTAEAVPTPTTLHTPVAPPPEPTGDPTAFLDRLTTADKVERIRLWDGHGAHWVAVSTTDDVGLTCRQADLRCLPSDVTDLAGPPPDDQLVAAPAWLVPLVTDSREWTTGRNWEDAPNGHQMFHRAGQTHIALRTDKKWRVVEPALDDVVPCNTPDDVCSTLRVQSLGRVAGQPSWALRVAAKRTDGAPNDRVVSQWRVVRQAGDGLVVTWMSPPLLERLRDGAAERDTSIKLRPSGKGLSVSVDCRCTPAAGPMPDEVLELAGRWEPDVRGAWSRVDTAPPSTRCVETCLVEEAPCLYGSESPSGTPPECVRPPWTPPPSLAEACPEPCVALDAGYTVDGDRLVVLRKDPTCLKDELLVLRAAEVQSRQKMPGNGCYSRISSFRGVYTGYWSGVTGNRWHERSYSYMGMGAFQFDGTKVYQLHPFRALVDNGSSKDLGDEESSTYDRRLLVGSWTDKSEGKPLQRGIFVTSADVDPSSWPARPGGCGSVVESAQGSVVISALLARHDSGDAVWIEVPARVKRAELWVDFVAPKDGPKSALDGRKQWTLDLAAGTASVGFGSPPPTRFATHRVPGRTVVRVDVPQRPRGLNVVVRDSKEWSMVEPAPRDAGGSLAHFKDARRCHPVDGLLQATPYWQ